MGTKIITALLMLLATPVPNEEVITELDEPPSINLRHYDQKELELNEYGLVELPEEIIEEENFTQQITMTSFYDNRFGSGANITNFSTNQYGMTVDQQGYLVVATATNECLRSNDVGCARYTSIPNGYTVWSYGDTFELYFHTLGITLPAKVYDSCGACFWQEDYQRVDVHTNGTSLGKIRGELIIP